MRLLVLCLALVAACSGGKGGASPTDCAGLSQNACADTPGCVVDACDDCDCTPTYRGCVPEGVAVVPCPALGCPSPECCGATDTCSNGICLVPGASVGCGACNTEPSSCETDADCMAMDPTTICDPIQCSCDGNKACRPGCVDDSTCGDGTHCDLAAARCVPDSCQSSSQCPRNFACNGSSCERRFCADDSDCEDYCVLGNCYAERGTCALPPP